MNSWQYYTATIDAFVWDRTLSDSSLRERVESLLPGKRSTVVRSREEIPEDLLSARTMYVRSGGTAEFGRCPGTAKQRCCNYLTFDIYAGCNLGCSYCIMQSYLRNRTLEVIVPTDDMIARVVDLARSNPDHVVRLGTGEVGDSLLYDPLFDLSRRLVEAARGVPNLRIELKTKTDYVDHLLDVPHDSTTVIAFSLNPQRVIDTEEGVAASLEERLTAAERATAAGFGVAFHFDPIIAVDQWREEYVAVARTLRRFSQEHVEWISLGTLRYPPALREWIEQRPYALGEFVAAQDGKMRYPQPVRLEIYKTMKRALAESLPTVPVYLCMESSPVWRHLPRSGGDTRLRTVMRPVPGFARERER